MNKKAIIALIGIVLIFAVSYGTYLYNKPHKNVLVSKAELITTSSALIDKFDSSKDEVSPKLLGKIIEISGVITDIEESSDTVIVILNDKIKCEFNKNAKEIDVGQEIKIKGVYSGFDDMFEEITLIRCYVI